MFFILEIRGSSFLQSKNEGPFGVFVSTNLAVGCFFQKSSNTNERQVRYSDSDM